MSSSYTDSLCLLSEKQHRFQGSADHFVFENRVSVSFRAFIADQRELGPDGPGRASRGFRELNPYSAITPIVQAN